MNNKYTIIGFIVGLAVLIGVAVLINNLVNAPTGPDLTSFAQCLKTKGVTFYGAFWCPHCAATKKMFGAAESDLPYVECSTPDAQHQTQVCIDHNITSYPTWVFPDGSRLVGEQTLQALSDKSGCSLPAGAGSTGSSTAPVSTGAASTVQ